MIRDIEIKDLHVFAKEDICGFVKNQYETEIQTLLNSGKYDNEYLSKYSKLVFQKIPQEQQKMLKKLKQEGKYIFDLRKFTDNHRNSLRKLHDKIADLQKENEVLIQKYKQARHNVSVLQKKINKEV